MSSRFIFGVNTAVDNIITLSVASEMQQWISLSLLSSYKIFRIVLTIMSIKQYECEVHLRLLSDM